MIQTPSNQQRHTNIAIVRSKTKPKFELACYKNKVIDYRNGIEKDIDKVLQTDQIFSKVADGMIAKTKDLKSVFGTTDKEKIAIEILQHGELQISEKERKLMFETMFRDILNFVVNQCLNPHTKRPYTAGVIEREMKNLHFAVKPNKSTKVQALKLIKKLERKIPIVRAKMRLKVVVDSKMGPKFKKWLQKFDSDEYAIEKENFNQEDKTLLFHVLIDPGIFRPVDEWVINVASGLAEVIDPCVQELGDRSIEEYQGSAGDSNAASPQTTTPAATDDDDQDSQRSDEPTSKKLSKRAARKAKKARKQRHQDDDEEQADTSVTHEDDNEIEMSSMKPKRKSKSKRARAVSSPVEEEEKPEAEAAGQQEDTTTEDVSEGPNDPIPSNEDLFTPEELELLNTTRELNKNEKRKLRKLKKRKKQAMLDALE